jgi:Calcineurin-like phosphoesterase
MLNSDQFQRIVRSALEPPTIEAGDSLSHPRSSALDLSDQERAIIALRDAAQRLKNDPTLLSGDPKGVFTYEDPILAAAAYWARNSEELYERMVTTAGSSPGANLKELRWEWILTGIHAFLSRGDHAKVLLGGRTPAGPIQISEDKIRIAVVGDAGYRGAAQDKVLRLILRRHSKARFDFVIHLGDVYFAGSNDEMTRNFLDPFSKLRNAGIKVHTLVGNHDLYYGGESFLFAINILGQPGRYFLIENPHWRIACLDTSLGAERILGNDAQLDEGQLNWLEGLLNKEDSKRLVLMSHHFIISGWEKPASSLDNQLKDRVREKIFAWYWGHEHRCSLYDRDPHGFYGACVGNGSFLSKWSPPSASPTPDWYAKGRCTCFKSQKKNFWPHGFVELELTKDKVLETVWLENNEKYVRQLDSLL